jgi:sortase A
MAEPVSAASEASASPAAPAPDHGLSDNGAPPDAPDTAPPWPLPLALAAPAPGPTPVKPLPPPGQPVHLAIPSIGVATPVVELGVTVDAAGGLQWETAPFVAGHYLVTGLVGARSNVVISGHVLTRDMGNVFRDLYKVRRGAPVVVRTDKGEFTYRVADIRLVKPWEIDVLAPSAEPRLTLVTCAGQFDLRTRTFSERLVVVGDLVTGEY